MNIYSGVVVAQIYSYTNNYGRYSGRFIESDMNMCVCGPLYQEDNRPLPHSPHVRL